MINSNYKKNWLLDKNFVNLIHKLNNQNNINDDPESEIFSRVYVLYQLARMQKDKSNFVECGIFAGGSVFFTADFCNKKYIAIDSFEGLSSPGEFDSQYFKKNDLTCSIDIAKNTLKSFNHVEIVKGWVPDVFNTIEDLTYCYVHIDVDLYEPTKKSIEYFWPKLISGGVLICDDYGSKKTPGARKAMNEYFKDFQMLELVTGQCIVFKN
jgi:hypothetical protein